jgi:hypothetical protein
MSEFENVEAQVKEIRRIFDSPEIKADPLFDAIGRIAIALGELALEAQRMSDRIAVLEAKP